MQWQVNESRGVGRISKGLLAKNQLHSLESRALTHLESIGLGNAAFISMGGPQAHGNSLTDPMDQTDSLRFDSPAPWPVVEFPALDAVKRVCVLVRNSRAALNTCIHYFARFQHHPCADR